MRIAATVGFLGQNDDAQALGRQDQFLDLRVVEQVRMGGDQV
jgi:hypothetical protein